MIDESLFPSAAPSEPLGANMDASSCLAGTCEACAGTCRVGDDFCRRCAAAEDRNPDVRLLQGAVSSAAEELSRLRAVAALARNELRVALAFWHHKQDADVAKLVRGAIRLLEEVARG